MPELMKPDPDEAQLLPEERKALHLTNMLSGFFDFQEQHPAGIKADPHYAAVRCIDCRSPTAQVLGFELGTVYLTSSVGGIIPRPKSDPDGQWQSFFNVAHSVLEDRGLMVTMAHTDCQGVKKMVTGTNDEWLSQHAKKLYKDVRDRHPGVTIPERGTPLDPQFQDWVCHEIEMEIVRNNVERAQLYLDKAAQGKPTSPVVGVLLVVGHNLTRPELLMLDPDNSGSGNFFVASLRDGKLYLTPYEEPAVPVRRSAPAPQPAAPSP